jgi:ABC-type Zn uptake system ZnuABC Zn-binding protein ZnuA
MKRNLFPILVLTVAGTLALAAMPAQAAKIRVVTTLTEPQFPEKVPALIAQQTGARLVKLPIMPGGVPDTETYIKMMDYIVHTIAQAAK